MLRGKKCGFLKMFRAMEKYLQDQDNYGYQATDKQEQ